MDNPLTMCLRCAHARTRMHAHKCTNKYKYTVQRPSAVSKMRRAHAAVRVTLVGERHFCLRGSPRSSLIPSNSG
eukprot:1144388-Pelagomonas_calceolata.AAC.11